MFFKRPDQIPSSEITPEDLYLNRRRFIGAAGVGLAAAALPGVGALASACEPPDRRAARVGGGGEARQEQEKLTPYEAVTTYNNFYEFGTDKADPARNAHTLETRPWTVRIDGMVKKPATYDIDDMLKWFPAEERVYRMRCVEAWSMVIPWMGFPLGDLIRRVEPGAGARYVELTTLLDPEQMPGQRDRVLDWPYVEGLRLDEALHPLTILATGLYGKPLPNQNGAPLRLVVPWKYGFKGVKSIVRIRFTDQQPATTWALAAPQEYGFYANVNPDVDHPRWSQKRERRVGEFLKRPTLPFNGYGEQVASLYTGMDLRRHF